MIVGVDEELEVLPELVVADVMVAFDGGVLDGAVHSLDLAVGPRVVGLGEAVLDAVFTADLVEAVDAHASGPAIPVAWQVGKLDAPFDCLPAAVAQDRIVGQDGVQVVWHRLD